MKIFCAILCLGLGMASLILYIKVLWVHRYMPIGNEAEIMIYDDNMRMLEKTIRQRYPKDECSLYAQSSFG